MKSNRKRLLRNLYSIGFLILFNCSLRPQENSLDPTTTEGLILNLFSLTQVADLSGLVANYTFTGNSNDSVAGRNLSVGGGAPTLTVDRFGVANSAYAFNGASFFTASDSAPSALPSGSNPRTMCLWYNLTAVTGNFQADFITGSMDEVRIYNRTLRAIDVAAVYTAGQ